jgi:tRNA uridine 5-carboxymethylaminomethyl modification enzyme
MFTSRAEYRLTLRADNADLRLTPRGLAVGCVGTARAQAFDAKVAALAAARTSLEELCLTPSAARAHGLRVNQDGVRRSGHQLLELPGVDLARLAAVWPELAGLRRDVAELLEIEARYRGYLQRQSADVAAFRREECLALPQDLDFAGMGGLSGELRLALERVRPTTLGAAARIAGMTPAALTLLYRHARREGIQL